MQEEKVLDNVRPQVAYDRVLQAARNLIRAEQSNSIVKGYWAVLRSAVAEFKDSEYVDWCAEVNFYFESICKQQEKMMSDELLLKQLEDWDYQAVYDQGVTTIVAANMLFILLFTDYEVNED